ncbi:MAG: hypothetical protein ACP5HM_10650 [Anaerolineae bacterium]
MNENAKDGCGPLLAIVLILALVGVGLFLLVKACSGPDGPFPTCPTGEAERTEGCDEFTVLASTVEKEGQAWEQKGWYPLSEGETLSVDNMGEAELNFSECWPGHMYAFQRSNGDFRVNRCGKFASESGSVWCLSGFWYVSCKGEYTLLTGSAQIEKRGTTFWVMYRPEEQLTLVTVLEGEVEIRPVKRYPSTLGAPTRLTAGSFYFTMPDVQLYDVGGLAPRMDHPNASLGRVVSALKAEAWFEVAQERAKTEGVPIPSLTVPGGDEEKTQGEARRGYTITAWGDVFEDPAFQKAALQAVDWAATTFAGEPITARIGNTEVDVLTEITYDPDRAQAFLEEQGYTALPTVRVFYPQGDEELLEVAGIVARYLEDHFVENAEVAEASDSSGTEPVLSLSRE